MEPPVIASVIASATSLVVAVVGLIANGRGQRKAAREAHDNALALFEKQAEAQAQVRADEAEERKRHLHMEERRRLYARLLSLVVELGMARVAEKAREGHKGGPPTDKRSVAEVMTDLYIATDEIDLVAATPVAHAATTLVHAAFKGKTGSELMPLTRDFVEEARRDLGTDDSSKTQLGG